MARHCQIAAGRNTIGAGKLGHQTHRFLQQLQSNKSIPPRIVVAGLLGRSAPHDYKRYGN
jgi:hypothetical protein